MVSSQNGTEDACKNNITGPADTVIHSWNILKDPLKNKRCFRKLMFEVVQVFDGFTGEKW